jgi:hypothetical protein
MFIDKNKKKKTTKLNANYDDDDDDDYQEMQIYEAVVESSRKQLTEYEKCLNLFSTNREERDEKTNESEQVINMLQSKIKEAKTNLFSNLSITYKPVVKQTKDLFGKLIIKVSILVFA